MEKNQVVSFSLDMALGLLTRVADFFLGLFRPVMQFITQVAGHSWLGFAVIFMIFFMIFLVRAGAKSRKVDVYSSAMQYIGSRGLIASLVYLGMLLFEWLVVPALVMLVAAIINTVTGRAEPGLFGAIGFLFSASPARTAFFSDMATFYGSDFQLLPLGFKSTGLIAVAFMCMLVVGRALSWTTGGPTVAIRPTEDL